MPKEQEKYLNNYGTDALEMIQYSQNEETHKAAIEFLEEFFEVEDKDEMEQDESPPVDGKNAFVI